MVLTKEELVTKLLNIANTILHSDSFEGNIQYSCMDDTLKKGEFNVKGAFRTGNRTGQGSMQIFD